MVLDFIITCEQIITIQRSQGVDGAGVATIFEKMGACAAFLEARAGSLDFRAAGKGLPKTARKSSGNFANNKASNASD